MVEGPVQSCLRELHLPDPLIDPFSRDKIWPAVFALNRDELRGKPLFYKLFFDELLHGLIKNAVLFLFSVPPEGLLPGPAWYARPLFLFTSLEMVLAERFSSRLIAL